MSWLCFTNKYSYLVRYQNRAISNAADMIFVLLCVDLCYLFHHRGDGEPKGMMKSKVMPQFTMFMVGNVATLRVTSVPSERRQVTAGSDGNTEDDGCGTNTKPETGLEKYRKKLLDHIVLYPRRSISTGLIIGLRPAIKRRRYFVTTSLTGWVQA